MLILFDILLLVDKAKLRQNYAEGVTQIMHERYGATITIWHDAYTQIQRNWHDYFADLNFSGDEGFADFKEGYFRITRALFRIANVQEPQKSEIHDLSLYLLAHAPTYDDALRDPAKETITTAHKEGFEIAVMTYLTEAYAEGIAIGAKMREYVSHFIGFDTFEHFERDKRFYELIIQRFNISEKNPLLVVTYGHQYLLDNVDWGLGDYVRFPALLKRYST